MPRHKQPAAHDACDVCGGAVGTLTTDCPGLKIDTARLQELHETPLDYTDDRGWHLPPSSKRSPRFESTHVPLPPLRPDPREVVAPNIDWPVMDRIAALKDDLARKAIDWVLADRVADDHSAKLTRIEEEIAEHLPPGEEPNEHARELLNELEGVKIGFHLANQRAEERKDEFHQLARHLVTVLEAARDRDKAAKGALFVRPEKDTMMFTRTCGCTVIAGAGCPHFIAAKDPESR